MEFLRQAADAFRFCRLSSGMVVHACSAAIASILFFSSPAFAQITLEQPIETEIHGSDTHGSDTHGSDDGFPAASSHGGANDPFEGLNRYFFEVNLFIDDILLEPAAKGYRVIVPKPGRRAVTNFLNNLDSPVILANDVLQGEMARAGETTARFGINTTLGIGGLFDPAKSFGLVRHSEDFGQTLAVHGVEEGPYLMLPVLGPAPPRDLIGRGVDQLFDPLTWVGWEYKEEASWTKAGLGILAMREANLETFDEIERTSIDFYAQVRSLYRQNREAEIKNGRDDFDDLPDLDEFEIE